jgi:quercetin dioxygenase-like cupin family protein
MQTPAQQAISAALPKLAELPQVDCPLTHRFTPGMYTREIFMPKGTFIVSKIHKTEHPFVVLTGKARVWIEGEGVKVITAPHVGFTKPGTRRVLLILEDCRWLTFHRTDKTTVDEVEPEVIYQRFSNVEQEVIEQLKEEEDDKRK